ncbi:DUF2303 family protein [Nocardioides sp. LHG3406-4]|uniref:DUF2303 family protein n=1 Tax=Nocardioides sp. LHG3406-4 TaxID=2804575 RepID=UPI003CECC3C4
MNTEATPETTRRLHNPTCDTDSAVQAGIALAEPHRVTDDLHTVVTPAGAQLHQIDLRAIEDRYAAHPRRKTGTVHVQDASSFIDYIAKHGLRETEIWADPARQALVGIINAHAGTGTQTPAEDSSRVEAAAGHGDHRILLELIPTDSWTAWLGNDKKWMDQQAFAEHLEDNFLDITVPDAATMLEIAQSFHASTGVNFKSAQRLHSGEVTLRYEESITAKAGQSGDLDIPTEFNLSIQPYWGQNEACDINVRFRYRIRDGRLSLSYAMSYPKEAAKAVFDAIVENVNAQVEQPVFTGRPA